MNAHLRGWLVFVFLCAATVSRSAAQGIGDRAAALDRMLSVADSHLAAGEIELAERQYRLALFEGWLILTRLDLLADDMPAARLALARASEFPPPDSRAALALASVQLELGQAAQAVGTLKEHGSSDANDVEAIHVLVRALALAGHEDQAVDKLDGAVAMARGDPQVIFELAMDYLWLKRIDAADRLFAQVVASRPLAETHVLVGRAYRDLGEYERARQHLQRAIAKDPRVRRAHYYLGTLALSDPAAGLDRVERAISEFRQELQIANDDPLVLDQLGVALLEAGRPQEAVEALARAVQLQASVTYLHDLGRAQLAVDQPAAAIDSLRRAIALASEDGEGQGELETVHYRLGMALRALGPGHEGEASEHFADARRLAAHWTEKTSGPTAFEPGLGTRPQEATSTLSSRESSVPGNTSLAQPRVLERDVRSALARVYLNLGVIQARARQFTKAAELLDTAVSIDPQFPGVQYALGVSRFNAGEFSAAAAPLTQAVVQDRDNRSARHLLAMVSVIGEMYDESIELLEHDPDVKKDPSLEIALGISLAHGKRAVEAEAIFTRLLDEHGPSAPLLVGLGWALAYERKFESAATAVSKALAIDPRVPEGQSVLGFIQLQTGRIVDAEESLRAELAAHPERVVAQRLLAAVLQAEGRADQAIPLLRAIVDAWPEAADARLRLSEAYTKIGKTELAREQMQAYGRLAGRRHPPSKF